MILKTILNKSSTHCNVLRNPKAISIFFRLTVLIEKINYSIESSRCVKENEPYMYQTCHGNSVALILTFVPCIFVDNMIKQQMNKRSTIYYTVLSESRCAVRLC
jgi:hypothetical protein